LLAKLIVQADDRGRAIERMQQALGEFEIVGIASNLASLEALVRHPQVASGEIDTSFIEREIAVLTKPAPIAPPDMAAACAAALRREQEERTALADDLSSLWDRTTGWMISGHRSRILSFRRGAERFDAVLRYERDGLKLEFAGRQAPLKSHRAPMHVSMSPRRDNGNVSAIWSGRDLELTTPRGRFTLH
jgi:3-methylcrotonyl-CoA carboxylase alpha subunit